MKKYAIVVDSSCGLTQEQAAKLGWFYLPLYLEIDGVNYADGIEITPDTLFDKFNLKATVKTSSFNLEQANELFEKLSKEYEHIIMYPISKHLSSAYQTLKLMENDFPKLRVISSVEVVQLIAFDCIWMQNELDKDFSKLDEVITFLENNGFRKSITLIPKYNQYLVKGGRLHPAAALIAKIFKLVPLIKWVDGQLLKEGIGHKFDKSIMKNMTKKHEEFKIEKGFSELVVMEHSGIPQEEKMKYVKEIEKIYNTNVLLCFIPPVVSIHVGPESYALMLIEMKEETKQLILEKFKEINYKA
ncbi:DegV family protein [Mycoplasmopsis adleri]|uniref:DegV family protein n=1 Tax=Mycoplasmopsis adleri TaxID=51362 RepID=UPI003873ABC2